MVTKTVRTETPGAPVTSQPASADHVESMEGLAAAAAAVDGGGDAGGEGMAPAPGAAVKLETSMSAEDIADMLEMGVAAAAPYVVDSGLLKEGQTEAIWCRPALLKIAKPMLAIMERHGLGLNEAFDKWGPYVMLLAGIAAPGIATFAAIRANAREAAPDAKQQ